MAGTDGRRTATQKDGKTARRQDGRGLQAAGTPRRQSGRRRAKVAKRRPSSKRPKLPPAGERIAAIIERLYARFPEASCALRHDNPLELLVATILSAQCTDARVNVVTRDLFRTYRTAHDYAAADPAAFERQIVSTGFFRNKTKSILGMAQALVDRHAGRVPETMDELKALPGVGRKTANVVLGTAFGKNEGVVVDTHVARIAQRLRLTRHGDPEKIERDLMALVPQPEWTQFGHTLIHHGRQICEARKPACEICPVADLCPSAS